ncbi:cytochrome P450 9e2-like isoform X6 [Aethina tumida]|uniref:cytochrome P450 9e2-like isoform X6 n=1 Tax=Aethina tumida TaxID=116153 RepID=UPI0021493C41|nr:cytochrome P450 9e2-like isoform X6 [Aethina tumida]
MLWIILLLVALALGYYYLIYPLQYWRRLGVKQGNPIPILGDFKESAPLSDLLMKIYNLGSNVRYTGMYQLYTPTLVLKDPELIKQILVKDFDHFMDHKPFLAPESDVLWSNNLVALEGQKWKEMRSTLSPCFTSSKMRTMFTLIEGAAKNFTEYFTSQNENTIRVELKDIFTRYANDVIASCAFGIEIDSLKNKNNDFYAIGKELSDFTSIWKNIKFCIGLLIPSLCKILDVNIFNKKVSQFLRTLVKDSIKIREREGIVRPDLIHLLMEARKGKSQENDHLDVVDAGFATLEESDNGVKAKIELTDDQITAQAGVFFFAGFESVSGLMSFAAYELAINPDIQDRLRNEIQDVLDDNNGKVTYEGLLKMKYMDMVVTETMRKWPNTVQVDRMCTKPYTIEPKNPGEKPIRLNVGDPIWIPIWAIHRDPQYYPDPEKFDPERFNDENKYKIVPYTFLTFGLGPRSCIGNRFALLEVKAVLFYLLSKFRIVPTEKTDIPMQLHPRSVGLNAINGFWVAFEKL